PAVVVSPSGTTVAPLHVSLAVGAAKTGLAGHSTVPLAPTSMVGLVVSTTMMVCVCEALVLPHASIACQLLVSLYVFPHPAVVVSPSGTTVAPLHVSEAVGAAKTGLAGHSTVPLAPTSMVGLVVSTTMMVCVCDALVLPHASIACQLLVSLYVFPQ